MTPSSQAARRPAYLDAYEGRWVAVKDDAAIADADTSIALARQIRQLGPAAMGCSMQLVRPPTDAYIVGAG